MTNLDNILKSRDITLLTEVHIIKAMVFPVDMYRCESWTIKKAEHETIDIFVWCWRKLLRVPWTARRSNQWILKEINPEYSLEGLMLGKTEGQRRRGWERMRWLHHQLNGHEFEQILGDNEGQESLECSVHKVTKSWTWLSTWTTIAWQLGNAKLTSIGKSWRDCNLKWINAIKFIFFTICPMPTVVIRIRIQCIFICHHV